MKRFKAIIILSLFFSAEMTLVIILRIFNGMILSELLTKEMLIQNSRIIFYHNLLGVSYFFLRRNSNEKDRKRYNQVKQLFKDLFYN